jgi:ketosteroid isomerase-like protein
MKRTLAVLALLCVAAPVAIMAQGDRQAERELAQLVQDIHAAVRRKDEPYLQRVIAEDLVNTQRYGAVQQNRAQWLAQIRSGAIAAETHAFDNIRARIYGDVAVVDYSLRSKGRVQGRANEDTARVLRVFVKRDGRWQCVAAQYTPVTPP